MTIDFTQSEARLLQSAVHAYLDRFPSEQREARELESLLERLPDSGRKSFPSPPRFTAVESL